MTALMLSWKYQISLALPVFLGTLSPHFVGFWESQSSAGLQKGKEVGLAPLPTHMPGILPLQRALALRLVEQGHVLGLQPCDGLRPIVLGVKMDLPDLGGRKWPVILQARGWQSRLNSASALDPYRVSVALGVPLQQSPVMYLLCSEPCNHPIALGVDPHGLTETHKDPSSSLGSSHLPPCCSLSHQILAPQGLCTCCLHCLELSLTSLHHLEDT